MGARVRRAEPEGLASPVSEWKGFGPGKVILLGEHGVVYGHPALVGPLPVGVTATCVPDPRCSVEPPPGLTPKQREALLAAFERLAKLAGRPPVRVRIESALPVSVGLGSSAALSVSCARALFQAARKKTTPNQIVAAALEMEKEFHGTPSGVDHTCSAMGALIEYQKKPGAVLGKARELVSPRPLFVVVALAGARTGTKATVAALRDRQATWKKRYARLFKEIAAVVAEGCEAVEEGDLAALGDAMNVNHGLLSALGLSSSPLDDLVYKLRGEGALGAKLTGAGGDGGAVIGLFENPTPVVVRLKGQGITCFESQIAGPIPL